MNPHPSSIGPYTIERRLESAATAALYLARNLETGHQVLLFTTSVDAGQDGWIEQAGSLAALNLDAFPKIEHCGCDGDQCFLAFEHVEGETLSSLLDRHAVAEWPQRDKLDLESSLRRAVLAVRRAGISNLVVSTQFIWIDSVRRPLFVGLQSTAAAGSTGQDDSSETLRALELLLAPSDFAHSKEPAQSSASEKTAAPLALDENVQFTVYRPSTLTIGKWETLLAFAHLAERRSPEDPDEPDPAAEVARQAAALLKDPERYRHHTEDSLYVIPREGEISFVPSVLGVEFNPPTRTFLWTDTVHREEFRLRALSPSAASVLRGRMTVYLGALVIAEIGMSFKLGAVASSTAAPIGNSARPYRKIFASYSHQDVGIVAQYSNYARALGDRYLQDVIDLRSGERWASRLEEMIREADVFQLFWSWNALESQYVEQEYRFALGLRRPSFVRPVYWDDPLPARGELPPGELRSLHFERIAFTPPATNNAPASTAVLPAPASGSLADRPRPTLGGAPRETTASASSGSSRPEASPNASPRWSSTTLSTIAALLLAGVLLPVLYRTMNMPGGSATLPSQGGAPAGTPTTPDGTLAPPPVPAPPPPPAPSVSVPNPSAPAQTATPMRSPGTFVGSVTLGRTVTAEGLTLDAGTYQVRLVASASEKSGMGQSPEATEPLVEFVQAGRVVAREVASVIPNEELATVVDNSNPPVNGIQVQTLKGSEYVRVWINRASQNYLIHLRPR